MKDRDFKKLLILGIVVSFVGAGALPLTVGIIEEKQRSINNTTAFMVFHFSNFPIFR